MTTPEPGQHVWIEAEVREAEGVPVLCVFDEHGFGARTHFDPARVVWHPADVPPQPLEVDDAQDSPARPPQATQDDPQPPNAADAPRDDPGATQGVAADWNLVAKDVLAHMREQELRNHLVQLRADRNELEFRLVEMRRERDALQGAGNAAHKLLVAANAKRVEAQAERDAARRELQQLRDEIATLAADHQLEAEAAQRLAQNGIGDAIRWRTYAKSFGRVVDELRAALAGATHNNQENQ